MLSNAYLRVCRANVKSVLIFNHKRMNQKEKSDACDAIKKGLSKSTGYCNWREVKSIYGTRRQSLGSKTLTKEANTELRRKSVGAKYKGWSSKAIQKNKTEVTQGGCLPSTSSFKATNPVLQSAADSKCSQPTSSMSERGSIYWSSHRGISK